MFPRVDSQNEVLAAWADPGFLGVALDNVWKGAEVTLDACSTGFWLNAMLYYDENGNLTMAFPSYWVST